jgi:hypothetical protein
MQTWGVQGADRRYRNQKIGKGIREHHPTTPSYIK